MKTKFLDLTTVPSGVKTVLISEGYTMEHMRAMTRREIFVTYCASLELRPADDLWDHVETLYRLKTQALFEGHVHVSDDLI